MSAFRDALVRAQRRREQAEREVGAIEAAKAAFLAVQKAKEEILMLPAEPELFNHAAALVKLQLFLTAIAEESDGQAEDGSRPGAKSE